MRTATAVSYAWRSMPRFLSTLAPRIGLAAAVVLMLAIGFLPLFGGPGYESAFAAGLVVPLCVALATALEVARARAEPFEAFCRGVANGGLYAAAVWLTTLFHGLRDGFCDFLGGSTLFALGPACGALLAGAWGALAGEIGGSIERPVRRRLATLALAMAGPIGSALVSLVRFYTSPMVFAYDPFVGYFSGTLYDTIIDHGGLLAYRAGSAATLFAAFVAAMHLVRDDRGRLHFHSIGRPGLLVAGGVALTASLTSIFLGNRLGHWQTSQSIAAELGAVIEGQRCQVVYARGLRLADAQRFARDCDAHVAAEPGWASPARPRSALTSSPTRRRRTRSWAPPTPTSPSPGATRSTCSRAATRTRRSATSWRMSWPARWRAAPSAPPAAGAGSSPTPGSSRAWPWPPRHARAISRRRSGPRP